MEKISLSLDEGLIPKNDREEIINLIKKAKNVDVAIFEGDLGASGGMAWTPRDLVIAASGLTMAGFLAALGEDIYKLLKERVKKILSASRPFNEMIDCSYISFDLGNIILFFEVNRITVQSIDRAYEKIITDFHEITREVERLIKFKPEKLTGKIDSITFIFDDLEDQWIIAHFNKY